MNLAKMAAMQS